MASRRSFGVVLPHPTPHGWEKLEIPGPRFSGCSFRLAVTCHPPKSGHGTVGLTESPKRGGELGGGSSSSEVHASSPSVFSWPLNSAPFSGSDSSPLCFLPCARPSFTGPPLLFPAGCSVPSFCGHAGPFSSPPFFSTPSLVSASPPQFQSLCSISISLPGHLCPLPLAIAGQGVGVPRSKAPATACPFLFVFLS